MSKLLLLSTLGLCLLFTLAVRADSFGCYPQNQPTYHYYHHYQYDRFPGGTATPKDYTYDPYPQYRGFTYTHPPVYKGNGYYLGNRWYGDTWGWNLPAMGFHY